MTIYSLKKKYNGIPQLQHQSLGTTYSGLLKPQQRISSRRDKAAGCVASSKRDGACNQSVSQSVSQSDTKLQTAREKMKRLPCGKFGRAESERSNRSNIARTVQAFVSRNNYTRGRRRIVVQARLYQISQLNQC